MAIFRSFLLGDVKNSVANLTMYNNKGVSIVRSKPLNVRNPRTPKQLTQRAKMGILTHLSSGFLPAITLGYAKLPGLLQASNQFVKENLGVVTVDEAHKATVDFTKLSCSSGGLKRPLVAVSFRLEDSQFVFTQTAQEQTLTCSPTDVVYAVVYEKEQCESEVYKLKMRSENGESVFRLPQDWKTDNCEFYAFACSENGKQSSKTSYLTLTD